MSKALKIVFIVFVFFLVITICLLFGLWTSWKKNSSFYLKRTEIYYNTLVRFSSDQSKYKYIQNNGINNSNYTVYPIKVLDRYQHTIGYIKTNNKIVVPFSQISPNFINALISTEDQDFYKHNGFNLYSIFRAFFSNLVNMKIVEGGSTITQQLSKILFTNQERTFKRKFNEFFTALGIEKNYTKNDILFMYSNLIYFGYNIYGVGLASKCYFGKDISELSVPEAALLVSFISNPSFYNPYKHVENAKKKHLAVLINMYQRGFISKEDVAYYYNSFWKKPTLLPKVSLPTSSLMGSKGLYVVEEVRRFLSKRYGNNYLDELQGSTVNTTIDVNIQNYIDETTPTVMNGIAEESPLQKEDKKRIQSATIVSKVNTGEILAFSGGNQFSDNNQFNRAFQAKRQVGSAIKPFLYTVGLDLQILTPYTVFEDVPIEVEFSNKIKWDVNNYAQSYRGYLNVADALKRSSNVVAVQATDRIGIDNIRTFFQKALLLNDEESQNIFYDYQYSIALGAVNLTPLQLNQLYQIIANNGKREELYFISDIEDVGGNIIYQHQRIHSSIFSKEACFLIQKILTNVLNSGGSGNYVKRNFVFNSQVAGKTGTTQNSRDVWFSGFTTELNITTWIGQDDNKSLGNNFVGGIQAGRLFGYFMKYSDSIYPGKNFTINNGSDIITCDIDLLTGLLPTNNTLFKDRGTFIKGTEPKTSYFLTISDQLNMALKKRLITQEQKDQIEQNYEQKKQVIDNDAITENTNNTENDEDQE